MLSVGCVLRRRRVQGARGVAGTTRGESASAGIEIGAGRTMMQVRIGGIHQSGDGRTNVMARGGPVMTKIAVAADTRTRTRNAVVVIGVPVNPKTLNGHGRFLLRTSKMNDVDDDAGRKNLGVLRRTIVPPTRTRGTTGAHTATDAGTDRALLRRRHLVRRRCQRGSVPGVGHLTQERPVSRSWIAIARLLNHAANSRERQGLL